MLKLKSLISENVQGKTLISVDIQPEYEKFFSFKPYQFTHWLNEIYPNINELVFLYNGEDTMVWFKLITDYMISRSSDVIVLLK